MIKITKPAQPPDILSATGVNKCVAHCREFTLFSAEYQQGTRMFTFDSGVYGHPSVKQALIAAQHGKCCFCERKVGEEGDVEHFRPKAAVRQRSSTDLLRLGYYWLAYDWDNLLLSCSYCNQRQKKNLFPLRNLSARARSHHEHIAAEEPLFLHPAHSDPEEHISFRKEIAFAIPGSSQGRATRDALALNRANLVEVRRDKLNELIILKAVLDSHANLELTRKGRRLLKSAKARLEDAVTDKAEFAGMARAAAKQGFRLALP